jgi:ABC-type Zn2+ transport system substrate-binding protein/surface adhesin
MYIKKGKFRGMTVKQLLDIGNNALGKCGSIYKLSDIRNMAKQINDNYKNGDEDRHRLVCNKNDCSPDEHHDHDHDHDDDHDDHHHHHHHHHDDCHE